MANKAKPVQVGERSRAEGNIREKTDIDVENANSIGRKVKVNKGACIRPWGIFAPGFGREGEENRKLQPKSSSCGLPKCT